MPQGPPHTLFQSRQRLFREQLNFLRTIGGVEELARRQKMAQEAVAALPPGALEHAQRQLARHWARTQTLSSLVGPIAEAVAIHVVTFHGPIAANQAAYAEELGQNVALFDHRRGPSDAIERSDLLASSMLPIKMAANPEAYQPSNVAATHAYISALLTELEQDYAREPNPVFAWEAFHHANCLGHDVPEWVTRYLADAAASLVQFAEAGRGVGDEAKCVGNALGFGKSGPGRGGWFERASIHKRDRQIYRAMKARLAIRRQLTAAYEDVADEMKIGRSTVSRSYWRMKDWLEVI